MKIIDEHKKKRFHQNETSVRYPKYIHTKKEKKKKKRKEDTAINWWMGKGKMLLV